MASINTDHINQQYIEDIYSHDDIFAKGKDVINRGTDGARRHCMLSSYDVAYEGVEPLTGTPEEVKELLWQPFQKKINELTAAIRGQYSDRKFQDDVRVTVTQDPTEECFDIRVFVPYENDYETTYRKGIQSLMTKEKQTYIQQEKDRLKAERLRKKDESDLKRLVKKNPELAKKLLTEDNS